MACCWLAACKKKDENPKTPEPVSKSKYTYLTTDKWRVAEVYAVNNAPTRDIIINYYLDVMKECEKDNLISFNTDGTITSDEGPLKCDTSIAQITTDGNWLVEKDTTQFTLKDSKAFPLKGNLSAKIEILDDNTFTISKDTTVNFGTMKIEGTIYASFKKIK